MDKKKTNLAVSVDLTISEEILKVNKCNSQKLLYLVFDFATSTYKFLNVTKFCEYGVPNYPCKIKNKIEFVRFGQSIFWGKEHYQVNGRIKKNIKCIVR